MDLDFSEEQLLLQKTARNYLEKKCPFSLIRGLRGDNNEFPIDLWRDIAALGWLGLIFPSCYGGEDFTFLDFVILAQETGRALLPLPMLQSVIAGMTILEAGSEHLKSTLVPQIAKGQAAAVLAVAEEDGDYHPGNIKTSAVADGQMYRITGTKSFVQYAPLTNVFIVAARTGASGEGGITLFIIDARSLGLQCVEFKSTTGRRYYQLSLDSVAVSHEMVLGEIDKGWQIISQSVLFEAAAMSAAMLGSAEKVLEMTLDIAKNRIQFDRPIGSFQAIQQLCADMVIDVDSMRCVTYQAANMLSQGIPCSKETAIARIVADNAYKRVVASSVKIHGGIGFTLEHDVGLHFLNSIDVELPYSYSNYYRRLVAEELTV